VGKFGDASILQERAEMTLYDSVPSSENAGIEEKAAGGVPKIAVVLPDQITARACPDLGDAAILAVGGTLAAVHIGADPTSMLASAEEIDIQFLRERYEGTAKERVAQVRSVFDEWLSDRRESSPVCWRDCSGDIDQCLDSETRDADLVVVPRTGNMDARDVVHGLLFRSHKLCLLPPYRQQRDVPFLSRQDPALCERRLQRRCRDAAGKPDQFAYDPETGLFQAKKLLAMGFAFPFAFGFLPSTRGEDGNPLDVLILTEADLPMGSLVRCRLIGGVAIEESAHGERSAHTGRCSDGTAGWKANDRRRRT
jgi:hypothetical protein